MVGPSPPFPDYREDRLDEKQKLRAELRAARRAHVASLPDATRALLFLRPPAPVAALAPEGAVVGLYHAAPHEAPTRSYARWLYENGRTVALPWFASRDGAMTFRRWLDPYDDANDLGGLETGPWSTLQPATDAEEVVPDAVFVPLIGFTAEGARLGQGGGHYDRWLSEHPHVVPIGLAWDSQRVDALPTEPHDRPLRAVVTPTRFYANHNLEGAG
jgi:5-formyltetrahydrofolate cyclo-ligase